MPAHSKGLTWKINLRGTDEDRAAIQATIDEYAECGATISMNDAVRILIARARRRPVDSFMVAAKSLEAHLSECQWCTPDGPVCPDGKRLKTSVDGLAHYVRTPGKPPAPESPRPRLLPPPPGVKR